MAKIQIYNGGAGMYFEVIIPECGPRQKLSREEFQKMRFPVLWLLHPMGCNGGDWTRFSQIETFANEKSIMVVCPTIMNAFWTDEPVPGGNQWQTLVTEELWIQVHGMFPASSAREDNFVAGNSMGGYGAIKFALSCPEKFSCCASFSACLDIPLRYARGEDSIHTGVERAFGPREKVEGGENDLLALAKGLCQSGRELPRIYISCGNQDKFFPCNVKMKEELFKLGYDLTWKEENCGHEWRFWNKEIEHVLDWIGL